MSLQVVNMTQAAKFIKAVLQVKLVPYIAGSPGMGKSAMIQAIAEEFNLFLIDIRLAQEDPTTINGFPDLTNGRSCYAPPKRFPLKGDLLPLKVDNKANRIAYNDALKSKDVKVIQAFQDKNCYAGFLIFFDELPSAPKSIQAASYKIILDRMIGDKELHQNAFMIAAGNLLTDGAIVYEMGSALRSRLVHIHVKSDPEEYLAIAPKINLDMRMQSYLGYQKSKVNTFDEYNKGSADETFCCERTWHMASKIIQGVCPDQNAPVGDEWSTLLQGTLGSNALEFVQYTHAFKHLPTFAEVLANPTSTLVPSKPAVRWLLVGMLVGNADMNNIDTVMDYVARLPQEFQFAMVKMLWTKGDSFLDNDKVMKTFDNIGDALLV